MYEKWQKIFRPEASLFLGVLFVGLLGFIRPYQEDLAHIVGIPTMGGGRVLHGAHFELGKEFLGKDTIFLTASVTPPISGDIKVNLIGPEELDYELSSRNPPGVPLVNGNHPWYRFEGDMIKGVQPGDDLVVVVAITPPKSPGEYEMILSNAMTGQVYLDVPVSFTLPGEESHAETEVGPSMGTWGGTQQGGEQTPPIGGPSAAPGGGEEPAPGDDALEPCH